MKRIRISAHLWDVTWTNNYLNLRGKTVNWTSLAYRRNTRTDTIRTKELFIITKMNYTDQNKVRNGDVRQQRKQKGDNYNRI